MTIPGNLNFGYPKEKFIFQQLLPLEGKETWETLRLSSRPPFWLLGR